MEAQGFSEDKENVSIEFCGNDYLSATKEADSIVVMTEWDEFNKYDYAQICDGMNKEPTFYDLRAYMDY
jgi:UDP-glucose 6-dehydrogenase